MYVFKKKIFEKKYINNSFFIDLNEEDMEDAIKKKERAENDAKWSIKKLTVCVVKKEKYAGMALNIRIILLKECCWSTIYIV